MDNSAFHFIAQNQPTGNLTDDSDLLTFKHTHTVKKLTLIRRSFPLSQWKTERGGRLLRVHGDGSGVEWRVRLGLFLFM